MRQRTVLVTFSASFVYVLALCGATLHAGRAELMLRGASAIDVLPGKVNDIPTDGAVRFDVAPISAAGCTYSVTPTSTSAPAANSFILVNVTTDAGCGWSVSSGASWLMAVPASGIGSGRARSRSAPTLRRTHGPAR